MMIGSLLIGAALASVFGSTPIMRPHLGAAVATAATLAEGGSTPLPSASNANDNDYLTIPARTAYQATMASQVRMQTYTVQPGDSLWEIAEAHETDLDTLLALNDDVTSTVIQPGQTLNVVPGFIGLVHRVNPGETLSAIGQAYGLTVDKIMAANGLSSADALAAEALLLLPGATPRTDRILLASRTGSRRAAVAVSRVGSAGGNLSWIWPIGKGLISSEFGSRWGGFHNGLDIAVPVGTPAAAAAGGTVVFAGWDGGYGYSVIIDHGGVLQTRYAHASKLLVAEGQVVKQGDPVILVGTTGNSTGPHLHFEVLVEGSAHDPREFLPNK